MWSACRLSIHLATQGAGYVELRQVELGRVFPLGECDREVLDREPGEVEGGDVGVPAAGEHGAQLC